MEQVRVYAILAYLRGKGGGIVLLGTFFTRPIEELREPLEAVLDFPRRGPGFGIPREKFRVRFLGEALDLVARTMR